MPGEQVNTVSDEQLRQAIAEWEATNAGPAHRVLVNAAKELLQLHSTPPVDIERVKAVVRKVGLELLSAQFGAGAWFDSLYVTGPGLIHAIAASVAAQLMNTVDGTAHPSEVQLPPLGADRTAVSAPRAEGAREQAGDLSNDEVRGLDVTAGWMRNAVGATLTEQDQQRVGQKIKRAVAELQRHRAAQQSSVGQLTSTTPDSPQRDLDGAERATIEIKRACDGASPPIKVTMPEILVLSGRGIRFGGTDSYGRFDEAPTFGGALAAARGKLAAGRARAFVAIRIEAEVIDGIGDGTERELVRFEVYPDRVALVPDDQGGLSDEQRTKVLALPQRGLV